ncbi:MAG: hypothetical protein V8R48_14865 [Eggerthella lenta]
MGPINNRRQGARDGTEPLSAQPSPFDQNAFDRIAFEPIEGLPGPLHLVDAEALADMRAFNDLKAKRKKQRKRKIIIGAVSAVAVLAVAGGAFARGVSRPGGQGAAGHGPADRRLVEQGTFVETVSASCNLCSLSRR